jgi:tripeptide aminopeptidase
LLESCKLDRVYHDAKGNLIAIRKGTGGAKAVVVDAHLDTVFQEGLKIRAEIRDGKVFAPGVGDDTRNIEAILASIRALDYAGIRTRADLIFVFTVEEETSFGGAKHFIAENKDRIGQYVALDGGYEGLTYGGIGINWYKHHFIGPGGHTTSKTPPYSATLPAARAIERIYALELPKDPAVHLNIGMLGGSDVVNAKAADAWFTVDLRSTDQKSIDDFERRIGAIVQEEASRFGMTVKTEDVEEKVRAAQIPGNRESFTVRMAEAVHLAMGFENVTVSPTASNNANMALLAGLPAISTGCAPCGGDHSMGEWCHIEPFYKGVKKLILLEVALASQ